MRLQLAAPAHREPEGVPFFPLWLAFLGRPEEALELDTRRRLYEHVRQYPGLHLSELARGVALDVNLAKYHLQYLEKHGVVSSRRDEGFWRFFPREEGSVGLREAVGTAEKQWLSILRRPVPLRITLHLLDAGEASLTDLRSALSTPISSLSYHVERMVKEGFVAETRTGRERRLRLADAPRTLALILAYKPPDAVVRGFLEAWESLEAD